MVGRLGSSDGPLVFGIDETLERRWGRKIAAKGRYRDPVRSTDDQTVMTPGLQWGEPHAANPYRWGGSALGAVLDDRVGAVGPATTGARADGARCSPTMLGRC